jgi:hypothetical protein
VTAQSWCNRYETDSMLDKPKIRKSMVSRSYTYHSNPHEFWLTSILKPSFTT